LHKLECAAVFFNLLRGGLQIVVSHILYQRGRIKRRAFP